MVSIDGRRTIVGGHNLLDSSYNSDHPVIDISMAVEGPAVASAHRFADVLWDFACEHYSNFLGGTFARASFQSSLGAAGDDCPKSFSESESSVSLDPDSNLNDNDDTDDIKNVPMLALFDLGVGMDMFSGDSASSIAKLKRRRDSGCHVLAPNNKFNYDPAYRVNNPHWTALVALVQNAKKSVFISQQDVIRDTCVSYSSGAAPAIISVALFDAIAEKIKQQVPVTIVVSTPRDDGDTGGYSVMQNLRSIPSRVLDHMCLAQDEQCVAASKKILCKFLKVASVRITNAMTKWMNTKYSFVLHTKTVLVDDAAFYIGSRNLYPSPLQQFGYITENPRAARHYNETFFQNLWRFSKETAIVDEETNKCPYLD